MYFYETRNFTEGVPDKVVNCHRRFGIREKQLNPSSVLDKYETNKTQILNYF